MRLRHALATWIAAACGAAFAQTGSLPDGPRPPSLPEAAFERIDQALRDRVATADTADALFVRGLQATMDPGARVSGYAEAYRRQPSELLFLASLADACMVRTIPAWPECASLDPVSRWASRDADNALPRVLLAERARQRSDLPGMREQLLYAAALPRFDSYRARGGVAVWHVLAGVPGVAGEPESPFAAAAIGAARADVATVEAAAVCRRDGPGVTPEVGEACRRLGRTMADRADTWEARQVGLAILWSWTDDAAARARLAAEREKIEAASLECNNARLALIEALNRDAASRAAARAIETGAIDDALKQDEPAVCAKLVARARQAKFL
jgi:hypothetical protein